MSREELCPAWVPPFPCTHCACIQGRGPFFLSLPPSTRTDKVCTSLSLITTEHVQRRGKPDFGHVCLRPCPPSSSHISLFAALKRYFHLCSVNVVGMTVVLFPCSRDPRDRPLLTKGLGKAVEVVADYVCLSVPSMLGHLPVFPFTTI